MYKTTIKVRELITTPYAQQTRAGKMNIGGPWQFFPESPADTAYFKLLIPVRNATRGNMRTIRNLFEFVE